MNSRLNIINKLLNNPKDLDFIEERLNKFKWDYTWKKSILTKDNLEKVFINNIDNYDFLSHWADIIELRDDVEYENYSESNISEIINILSTPEINWILTKEDFFEILNK